jgi:hypothetical protein
MGMTVEAEKRTKASEQSQSLLSRKQRAVVKEEDMLQSSLEPKLSSTKAPLDRERIKRELEEFAKEIDFDYTAPNPYADLFRRPT